MKKIIVDVKSLKESHLGVNTIEALDSFKNLMSNGYSVQIIHEAKGMKTKDLFQFKEFKDLYNWIEKGCPIEE